MKSGIDYGLDVRIGRQSHGTVLYLILSGQCRSRTQFYANFLCRPRPNFLQTLPWTSELFIAVYGAIWFPFCFFSPAIPLCFSQMWIKIHVEQSIGIWRAVSRYLYALAQSFKQQMIEIIGYPMDAIPIIWFCPGNGSRGIHLISMKSPLSSYLRCST